MQSNQIHLKAHHKGLRRICSIQLSPKLSAWGGMALSLFMIPQAGLTADIATSGRASVVKIHVASQAEDYARPWQARRISHGSGSGFIIKGKRILTNAHLVADVKFMQVQREGDAERYRASVAFIAHDCDLAILTLENDRFFTSTEALSLADAMPDLNDEVIVLGYPLGGNRLSVTKGVVSRIDFSAYSHSGVDQHLALQVDAAINPGNSGGPVMFDGHVVGVAFQGLTWADNIGYAIPLPVVLRFLQDVKDGHYDGYPELGAVFENTQNPARRKDLGLDDSQTGVVVSTVDPFGAAHNRFKVCDVILDINNHPIANDGSIKIRGERVEFSEIVERQQKGDNISFRVWRDGREISVHVPLDHPDDPFVFRNQYDKRPNYLIRGGLVFSPLSAELLKTVDKNGENANVQQLVYSFENVKREELFRGRTEFVVLMGRLPHAVNTYTDNFLYGIVTDVNGHAVSDLRDVRKAIDNTKNEFHVLRFQNMDDTMVLDARAMRAADPDIQETYSISEPEHLDYPPAETRPATEADHAE